MLAAGLDGVETKADYREPVNENIWEMSFREKRRLRIDDLPHDLNEALRRAREGRRRSPARSASTSRRTFSTAKRQEWREYITQVIAWELENYLAKY